MPVIVLCLLTSNKNHLFCLLVSNKSIIFAHVFIFSTQMHHGNNERNICANAMERNCATIIKMSRLIFS